MKRRGLVVGLGIAAAAAAAVVAAERVAARRVRSRPDPAADDPLDALPPDDLGPVRSFDGTELAVRAAGPQKAPPIVFSHGFSLNMTTWHYQWTAFSDRYRCVLFDHRAHGLSGKPPGGDYSVRAMGGDLRAVLDVAGRREPAVLVGHSMGGMAILSYAQQYPEEFAERVRGVVLVDSGASDLVRECLGDVGARMERRLRPLTDRFTADLERVERFRGRVRRVTDLAFLIAQMTQFGPEASPSHVEYVARLSSSAPIEVWVHAMRELQDMDLRGALANVRVPALVVVGDRDFVTPRSSAEAMRQALPDARAAVITGAGHVSMLEQHRVFNELLGSFLDEVVPQTRRSAAGR